MAAEKKHLKFVKSRMRFKKGKTRSDTIKNKKKAGEGRERKWRADMLNGE